MNKATVRKEFTEAQNKSARDFVRKDRYRQAFHLMPPVGWLNDPNGLSQFNGEYHIFYQYTPNAADGQSHRGWGHYTTKDFIHYQEENDPFVPDTHADGKGSYSGSAFCKDGAMHLFFTGNNKLPGDYDYIHNGRIHWVLHSRSEDGRTFSPKEVLLKNSDYPDGLSCHVRDPKVFEKDGMYWMVLGARTSENEGEVFLMKSGDLKNWALASYLRPETPHGFMWECPDVFDLDGHWILMTCPQGIARSDARQSIGESNGWFEIRPDFDHDQIVSTFTVLDDGFDFYAPQTFRDDSGRRILIAWMGMPNEHHWTSPTLAGGWQHCLTLPRELTFKDGSIWQYPIPELQALRQEKFSIDLEADSCMTLPDRQVELDLHPQGSAWQIRLRKDVLLSFKDGSLRLECGQSGCGRDERNVQIDTIDSLQIFSDVSSLEIFVNHGQKALTTRIYDDAKDLQLCCSVPLRGEGWRLGAFDIEEKLEKTDPTIGA